ncbi:uncharacterized protein LOC110249945 [Exaiptasia diaphana]|uniref:Uncharacterized protein n=1 Tax=Exaiptasia diaphana TaxID=2652724 RepID=A0A913XZG0_EXADI|nr:uncharacterized protein LOC110249945 [Exaiptasia diaphana]KXJ23721.1 Multiple epidermal growth factor-like domains protein 6 [Exaiptasia diaphana]
MYSLVFLLIFQIRFLSAFSSGNFLYENRLATFPKPDFNTSFILRSRKGAKSFKEIHHGLGVEPFYVRVYATPKSGPNKGFVFEGVGVNHVDAKYTSYGGVIFAYNSEYIRIWAPNNRSGYIIFVKDGWGREKNAQQTSKAIVFVQMWKSGPEPNFEIDTVIGNGTSSGSFKEIRHNLRQIPDRVLVRVSPENPVNSASNPNGGYWFHASGTSQNSYKNTSYGGVIFAYNVRSIHLWAPNQNLKYTGCILIDNGWGDGRYNQRESRCRVHIKVWVNAFPLPSYQTDWFSIQAQTVNSFKTIKHNLNMVPSYVLVQTRPLTGMNYHFVFEAQGSVQSDDNSNDYGGIIFAYDKDHIRLWAPSKNDGTKKGYGVLVKKGWGDDKFLQSGDTKIEVRIKLYGSKCSHNSEACFPSNSCVKTQYNTYTWVTSSWSKCSSICNKGQKDRRSTGCLVKSKGKIASGSCDFEKDFCHWTSTGLTIRNMIWKRTNTSTPTPKTGPLWGHPKGSFYAYTYSKGVFPHGEGVLKSPNIQGARRCHLTFFWNMYGDDIGELNVEVNEDWSNSEKGWKNTGWSMIGSHGRAYWRSAYINLERYSRIYHIRFRHVLPEKPSYCKDRCYQCKECEICKEDSCLYGNVAIDDIELWCEASYNITSNAECKARTGYLAGCDQPSVISLRHLRGPAYGEQVVNFRKKGIRTFVMTNGTTYDLVGKYFINVAYEDYYTLWMSVFSTNQTVKHILFQIDEGDWHDMTAKWTKIRQHFILWLSYRLKSFFLKPGLHTITFRQKSLYFRFDRFALSPTKLSTWVDLGMQNYHIPDSYLTAFPPRGSRPGPKHGRLNDKEAWCSTDHNRNYHYYEIKLPNLAILSRIAVQGANNLAQKSNNYWTKSFKLQVSVDHGGDHFSMYRNRSGGEMMFKANSDSFGIVTTELPYAVPVRAVRIYPQEYYSWVCLRAELYGMYLSSASCASAGPELPTTKPCMGDRDCGKNADCQKANSTSGMRKTIGDLWQKMFPSSRNTSNEEYCTCFKGHHGDSCQHYGCKPNPCQNNGTCKQNSQNGTFYCTCPPGYYGNTCQMSCQTGYYGYNCSQVCRCGNHSSCDEVTGHCNCHPGFTGKYCNDKCAKGFYGNNCSQKCQCKNGAMCNHLNGHCNCTIGWTGMFCQEQCPWNTWGMFCSKNCTCSKSALECNRKTGECICEDGHFGRFCEKICPTGSYGRNCTQTCKCTKNGQCSVKDGACNCTQPGFTGLLCDQPCNHGLYGVNCGHKCLCKNGADCDGRTGKCTCSSGWLGKSCDKPCPQDSWGLNCSQKCSCVNGAMCNSSTGQCSCTSKNHCVCHAGFTGISCNTPCSVGKWGVGCLKTCTCMNKGVCNPITGKCMCLPGFSGKNCNAPCVSGYYGNNCSTPCNCTISSQCDASGLCTCLPGRQGAKCNVPCSKGSWGLQCNQSCRCVHGSCHPSTGHCACDKGWNGTLCNQRCTNCGLPCPKCYHGSCNTVKGQCVCSAGYTGSSCLESCPSGSYGQNCGKKCGCVHGVCRPDIGTCDCEPGWSRAKCDQACPSGSYGYRCLQQCHCVNGLCNAVNGSCECNSGYYGYKCERQCPSGTYGSGCLSKCWCLNGGVCHHVTGRCVCKAGWMGAKCNTKCKVGYFGSNCTTRCSCKSCDPETGLCHCPPGWLGLKCTQPCPLGFYGNSCTQKCSCLNNGFCNHINGTCTCLPGFTGPKCQEHCPPGRFGMQCLSPCSCNPDVTEVSQPCHHITGDCNCRPGYHGLRCIDQCQSGFYGKNCTSTCRCQNNGVCNFKDGSCLCTPGYHGKHCKKTCPAGRYGVKCNSTCQCIAENTLTCSKFTGLCSCSPGYLGVKCENRCPEGKFGVGCHQACQCKNSAHCSHLTGKCICLAGFKGKDCGQTCDGFKFGSSCKYKCLCENGAKCNPVSGSCICSSGFTGKRCSNACLEGRFGINCSNICDCNPSNTKTCNHRDGTCLCIPGYTHRRCDQSCQDGSYGQDCQMSCPECSRHVSGPCNKQHGNCTCTPGYHGYECYDDCPLNSFGLQCKEPCICRQDMLCYHVDGTCLRYQQGLFTMVVMESLEIFNDIDRKRDFKLGIEQIMFTYYDLFKSSDNNNSVASQVKEEDTDRSPSFNLNEMDRSNNNNNTKQTSHHNFVARILEAKSVFITEKLQGTQLSCVVLDGRTVINASDVTAVFELVPSYKISNAIAARYYTGELYSPPKTSSLPIHLPLIIGASVGTILICTILITFKVRYCYLKKANKSAKKAVKDPAEFELLPYISQGSSHLLAFDNPYYDVLAVMGLDDDIEEEYSNPLYDDISLYSADSYNSSTDDSCHKDIVHMVVR